MLEGYGSPLQVERMVIGNKCDMEDRRQVSMTFAVCCLKSPVQVSRERGEQLAIEYGTKFMETSAKVPPRLFRYGKR